MDRVTSQTPKFVAGGALALVLGLWSVSPARAATPAAPNVAAVAALIKAHANELKGLTVGRMFQEGAYIVAVWGAGEEGGQVLAEQANGTWHLLQMGGGSLNNLQYLESVGVPAPTAAALTTDLTAAGL